MLAKIINILHTIPLVLLKIVNRHLLWLYTNIEFRRGSSTCGKTHYYFLADTFLRQRRDYSLTTESYNRIGGEGTTESGVKAEALTPAINPFGTDQRISDMRFLTPVGRLVGEARKNQCGPAFGILPVAFTFHV